MPVHSRIAEFHAEMTAWRRDFHRHPELGMEEHRTSAWWPNGCAPLASMRW